MAHDKMIGALEVSSWLISWLWMYDFVQTVRYYSHYKKDSIILKCAVATLLLLGVSTAACTCYGVYFYTISSFGNTDALVIQKWSIPVYLFCTGATAAIVQTYLTHRYCSLSKNNVVAAPLGLMIIAEVAAAFTSGVMIAKTPRMNESDATRLAQIIWNAVSVGTNVILAILLIVQRQNTKTGFTLTEPLVFRIFTTSVESGVVTSLLSIAMLITQLSVRESYIPTALGQILGQVYSLTLIANLNARPYKRREDDSKGYVSADEGLRGNRREELSLNGIHVHRTAIVHMDNDAADYAHKASPNRSRERDDDGDMFDKVHPYALS